MRRHALVLSLVAALVPSGASAESATFALVIGVNKSIDAELKPLRYADDDAARWVELFRALGAQTWLLARPDENTSRLHPQAAAEAREPVQANLELAVSEVAQALARAEKNQVPTRLYVVYAGHGNVRDGAGYLTLEDARLASQDLAEHVFDRLPAQRTHLIADACFSSFLVTSRGPGGVERAVRGFSSGSRLSKVGMILSTSSARESHEWEGFQAGVFSHEVRSGLYGAADANADGRVEYRELAAFVQRANEAIANEKYRPDVFAQSAGGDEELLDLRGSLERRVEISGAMAGHYLLEDARGVRLADFNNGPKQAVRLLRPLASGPLYLRRVSDEAEFTLPAAPPVLNLADLKASKPRVNSRGAANDAFASTFSLPFDQAAVIAWVPPSLTAEAPSSSLTRTAAIATTGLAAGALLFGVVMNSLAFGTNGSLGSRSTQLEANAANASIRTFNLLATTGYVGAGISGGLSVVLWLLTPSQALSTPTPTDSSAGVRW